MAGAAIGQVETFGVGQELIAAYLERVELFWQPTRCRGAASSSFPNASRGTDLRAFEDCCRQQKPADLDSEAPDAWIR